MASTKKQPATKVGKSATATHRLSPAQVQEQVAIALASLEKMSTRRDRDNLTRFGITASNALGVSMSNIQLLARRLGRSHELAAALWETGCYEARLLTSFVDEPERVTAAHHQSARDAPALRTKNTEDMK